MRGIISYGTYLPHRRLDRSTIAAVAGTGGGKGTRTVASYDEDTTTMAVEAARRTLRPTPARPDALWFSTVAPAYVDKANATAVHAALLLPTEAIAADLGGSVRSGIAALRLALGGSGTQLVVSADIRTGLPGSADEAAGGDAAAALLVGDDGDAPVIAELVGAGSATDEFLDRWRTPGDDRSKQWEEKFGETRYVPVALAALAAALADAGIDADRVDALVVAGLHGRACKAVAKRSGVDGAKVVDDLAATVGNPGAAQPGLLLASALDTAAPGQVIVLLTLSDGADALVFRTTDAIASFEPALSVAEQAAAGAPLPYGKFLAWRGHLTPEPPRRPEPARPSASAAARSEDWKYGFVGAKDRATGAIHLPPSRVSMEGGAVDDMEPIPMADVAGTIATYTIDKLVYSPSPPVVFAIVDFDGGGRAPIELTDVDPAAVRIGDRVEMTFRRLFTSDGIHNYFWKARPVAAPAKEA
ncbi:MAG: OB-fold domain-containing protein [Acidimicrobiales bacterium]|nr:OB-fold domain-containing protein [Acidimicrobiales bacterium]HRW36647.1 OB-fold domain-containing protein [Aquihabitans sp.]